MTFRHYEEKDYQLLCDFLIEVNRFDTLHINWNWARLEWMIEHPEFDKSLTRSIGLWFDEDVLVGTAIFDMYYGEASCITLPNYQYLYKEIVDYAYQYLKDDKGISVSVNDTDTSIINELAINGYKLTSQKEVVASLDFSHKYKAKLKKGYSYQEVYKDTEELEWLIYQGFDHGNDKETFLREYKLANNRVHQNPHLTLVIENKEGVKVAFAGAWYDSRTNYAYLEPLCVIPEYRGKGLATSLVYELANRVRELGAEKLYVISDSNFYKKIGFKEVETYSFYHKN